MVRPPLLFPLPFLPLLPLSLSCTLLYFPPCLAFTGSQITAFFQQQTQSRWCTGGPCHKWHLRSSPNGEWPLKRKAAPLAACLREDASLGRHQKRLHPSMAEPQEALGDCDCRAHPGLLGAGRQRPGWPLAEHTPCWGRKNRALPLIGHHPGPPHPGTGPRTSPPPHSSPHFPCLEHSRSN